MLRGTERLDAEAQARRHVRSTRLWWLAALVAFLLPLAALRLLVRSAPITPAFAYTLK